MKTLAQALMAASLTVVACSALAREDVRGIVDKRPDGKIGNWVVAGKEIVVDEKVRLDEKDGPAKVGACVELDYEMRNGVRVLEKIEVKKDLTKCQRR